jgi:RimJ/RimL family protein N-acetyltransferase
MKAEALSGERLTLTPLEPDDAEEMAEVLADRSLYEFTGGEPPDFAQLRARFERMTAGSGRPDEVWLNWVVRRRSDDRPVGTVQATVVERHGARTAWVAWVTGVPWQGRGFATEAARLLVSWLGEQGVDEVLAAVHREHFASERVAGNVGLAPTDEVVDGERVWRLRLAGATGSRPT